MNELRVKASAPMPLDIVPRFVASRREHRNFQIQPPGDFPNKEITSNPSSAHMRTIRFGENASMRILVADDPAPAKHFKRSGKPFLAIKPFEGERMNVALSVDPFDEPLP